MSQICKGCNNQIGTGEFLIIEENSEKLFFHNQCFVCSKCRKKINSGYTIHPIDKTFICNTCYPKRTMHQKNK